MAPPPPELIDEVTAEILLRLPPDEPEHLFRAALVCKPWLRILCDPAFLRRYRAHHGAPPLLSFILHKLGADPAPRNASTTAAPIFPHPWPPVGRCARALDCRHGRVLLLQDEIQAADFIVWNPVSGDRRCVPPVPDIGWVFSAAVLCVADGCDHLDCHNDGPFRLVLAGSEARSGLISACVYSSETCTWSTLVSLDNSCYFHVYPSRGAIVDDEIYFTLSRDDAILKYDWGSNQLSMVKTPEPPSVFCGWAAAMAMVDGSLGLADVEDSRLILWSKKVNSEGGDAEWVLCRVIELETVMPMASLSGLANVAGFADGVDVIFLGTNAGLFTIELKSGRVRMVLEPAGHHFCILPYMIFYTPSTIMPILSLLRYHYHRKRF